MATKKASKSSAPTADDVRPSTIDFPADLWKRARRLAVDEDTTFRAIVIAALEAYLTKKGA